MVLQSNIHFSTILKNFTDLILSCYYDNSFLHCCHKTIMSNLRKQLRFKLSISIVCSALPRCATQVWQRMLSHQSVFPS